MAAARFAEREVAKSWPSLYHPVLMTGKPVQTGGLASGANSLDVALHSLPAMLESNA